MCHERGRNGKGERRRERRRSEEGRKRGREGESEGEGVIKTWVGTSHYSSLRKGNLVVTHNGVVT